MLKRILSLCALLLLPVLMYGYDDPFVPDNIADGESSDSLTCNLQPTRCHTDGYYIRRMLIDVSVHADRSYDVEEQLDVFFTEPRHGLYRSIPKRFWVNRDVSPLQDSSQYEMRYNGVEVQDLAVSEEFLPEEQNSEILDVRIGSADVLVSGEHTYRLSYTLQLPGDRVEYADHFFHSVLGSEWTCSTDTVLFTIHFDQALPDQSLSQLKVYFGQEGDERNRRAEVLTLADAHTLSGVALNTRPGMAVTIDMPLPEGYFIKGRPSVWYYLSWLMAGITLWLIIRVALKEMKGDEPVTQVITFQPSKGITSADVGSLIDGSVDDVDLLSMIPWFAAEGYLQISSADSSKSKSDVMLTKLRDLPADAPQYQQALFDGFFPKGKDTFHVNKPTASFGHAWEKARQQLTKQYNGKLNTHDGLGLLLLSTFCFSLMMCFAQVPPEGYVNGGMINVALVVLYFIVSGVHSQITTSTSAGKAHGCAGCVSKVFTWGVVLVILFTMIGLLVTSIDIEVDYYLPYEVRAVFCALEGLVILFSSRLLRLTPYRREHLGEVKGLKEFINTAEKDRLQMLLDQDERYFYRILPYAMALGMVDKWASKFEGLTVKPAEEFSNVNLSHIPSMLSRQQFMNNVNRSVAAAHPSGSGGSYGSSSGHHGGYSGGGSGGGGGRSW